MSRGTAMSKAEVISRGMGLLKSDHYYIGQEKEKRDKTDLKYTITDHLHYKIVERKYDHFIVMQPPKHN